MSYLPDLSYQILTPAMVNRPSLVEKPSLVNESTFVEKPNPVDRPTKRIYYDEELNKYYDGMIKVWGKNKNKIIEYFLMFILICYVVIILYAIITY